NLEPPVGGWKLVIVDNASTDTTKQILRSACAWLPLTYLFEPKPGKNRALNSALHAIEGDVVVFTDDDAIPRSDWLVRARALADAHASFGVFGGVIVPQWEVPPPDWILPFQSPILSITDPSWVEGPTLASRVWGPNMMIRAEAFNMGHRFDESMGPTGSRYQMGDETEFVDRLVAAGFKAWHSRELVVAHMIRAHQMRKDWLLRRAMASGRAAYRRHFLAEPSPTALFFGFPRHLAKEIFQQALHTGWSKLFEDEVTAFKDRFRL